MSTQHSTRRAFLQSAALAGLAACAPRMSLAAADTRARFILVILRGALDGLAAVPAYGDGNYVRQRGALSIATLDHKLDGLFALNPALTNLHRRFLERQLVVFHATASPYRERSHFDGQDVLEQGATAPASVHDGWLNRMLQVLPVAQPRGTEQLAVALSQNVPLVLRGAARVSSWVPSMLPNVESDTLERIADLYSSDPYFAVRLHTALATNSVAGDASGMTSAGRDPLGQFNAIASAAGRLLAPEDGLRIAVIEARGWDTHASQGADTGQLANRLRGLDLGLEALRTELGATWNQTAVLIVTEFGRTVAVNGTSGTDHGTATCAFLVGGAVSGGRVIADWPGLAASNLYQGRDLQPTLDLRSVLKGVLGAHLGIAERDLEGSVFPDSRSARILDGLIGQT